ncbi:DERL1 family protein [Megaselia abdita]
MDVMVMCVIYIWCQMNKDVIVTFWFGTRFKAVYLPWVLLVVNFILSNGGIDSLSGIVVGHLYYFLKYQYPQEHGGSELIKTPAFLKNYFPDVGGVHGFGVPPASTARPRTTMQGGNRLFADSWGSGNTLGRN